MRIIIKGVKMDITYAYRGGYPKHLLYTITIPAQKVKNFIFERYTEQIWADELRIENKSEYKYAKAMWYVAMPDDNQFHLLIRAEATISKAKKEIRAERKKIAKHKKEEAIRKKEEARKKRKERKEQKATTKKESVRDKAAYLLYASNLRIISTTGGDPLDPNDWETPMLTMMDAERLARAAIDKVIENLDPVKDPAPEYITPFWLWQRANKDFALTARACYLEYTPDQKKELAMIQTAFENKEAKKC